MAYFRRIEARLGRNYLESAITMFRTGGQVDHSETPMDQSDKGIGQPDEESFGRQLSREGHLGVEGPSTSHLEGEKCLRGHEEGQTKPCKQLPIESQSCDQQRCDGQSGDQQRCEGQSCDKQRCEGQSCDKQRCEGQSCYEQRGEEEHCGLLETEGLAADGQPSDQQRDEGQSCGQPKAEGQLKLEGRPCGELTLGDVQRAERLCGQAPPGPECAEELRTLGRTNIFIVNYST